jgi:IS4 transposase
LKDCANPVTTAEFREWRGCLIPLEGKQIQDAVKDLHREIIDVRVEVEFQRLEYEKTNLWNTKRSRIVGVRDQDADDYHFHITNLPREEILLRDIATLYRCRWEVEVLFRELKTRYALVEFETTKTHVVEILVYAAPLTLSVSRVLLCLVSEHVADEVVFPLERLAATFRSHAQFILHELGQHLGYSLRH